MTPAELKDMSLQLQAASDWGKQPKRPEYQSLIDEKTGLLGSNYLMDPNSLEGLSAVKKQAFAQGPSAWANYMTDAQQMGQQGEMDAANAGGARQTADAWDQLAMRGGLGGGSRERIALAGSKDATDQRAKINAAGATARLNLLGQDEDRKSKYLDMFTQQEGDMKKYNIDQALADKNRKFAGDLEGYKEQMNAWAADRTARAQENASKK